MTGLVIYHVEAGGDTEPSEEVDVASLKLIRQRLEWARMQEEGIVRETRARVERLAEHRRAASEMAQQLIDEAEAE